MAAERTTLPAARAPKTGCAAPVRASKRSRWRAAVLVSVHLLVLAHILHWMRAGRTVSPVEPSEAHETLAYGVVNAGFVLLGVTVLSTLVLGRFFCGWACHVVALQDLCAWLLGKLGLRPRPVRSRLLLWVPVFAAVDVFVLPALWRKLDGTSFAGLAWEPTTDALWETFPGPWMAAATLLVDGFLVVYLFGAKGFCTYGCPYGAIFGAADRAAAGRIRVTDACEGCGHCSATCTSNVDVRAEVTRYGMVVDPGCMKCMDCVSVCPKDALYFGFGKLPRTARKRAGAKPRKQYDFTWPEEIAMALVFAAALFAFRNLYGAVPFLLAVGLAVIAGLATVVGWRFVAQKELVFQHAPLKRGGRLTRAGLATGGAAALYLAFAAHSGVIQAFEKRGDLLLRRAGMAQLKSLERHEAAEASLASLRAVDRFGLRDTAELHNKLGQLLIELDQNARAEGHLRRALRLDDSLISARMRLAEILIVARRFGEATDVLAEILERDPLNDLAGRRLGMVIEGDPAALAPRLLLVDLLVRTGDLEGAENGLAPALRAAPEDPEVLRRAAAIEAARAELGAAAVLERAE